MKQTHIHKHTNKDASNGLGSSVRNFSFYINMSRCHDYVQFKVKFYLESKKTKTRDKIINRKILRSSIDDKNFPNDFHPILFLRI